MLIFHFQLSIIHVLPHPRHPSYPWLKILFILSIHADFSAHKKRNPAADTRRLLEIDGSCSYLMLY